MLRVAIFTEVIRAQYATADRQCLLLQYFRKTVPHTGERARFLHPLNLNFWTFHYSADEKYGTSSCLIVQALSMLLWAYLILRFWWHCRFKITMAIVLLWKGNQVLLQNRNLKQFLPYCPSAEIFYFIFVELPESRGYSPCTLFLFV